MAEQPKAQAIGTTKPPTFEAPCCIKYAPQEAPKAETPAEKKA